MKNKNKLFSLLGIVLLSTGVLASAVSAAYAHTPPWTIPTYAFIVVTPNPVGVNQQAAVVFWLNQPPPTASGVYGDVWQNFTIAVSKPDGTTQTLGPFKSDPVGSSYTLFTPDKTGTYTFQMSYSGQTLAIVNPHPTSASDASRSSPYIGDVFQPSVSTKVSLVVQQAQVEGYPPAQLPKDYWQRPINANNREWSVIGGNWLGANSNGFGSAMDNTGAYNPYSTGPESAHVLWTKPVSFGGIVGGGPATDGTLNFYTGREYEPKFTPPIIMSGVLYYNTPQAPYYGFYAVDLRTGETLWYHNSTGITGMVGVQMGNLGYPGITFGQLLYYESPNQYGATPYLWAVAGSTYSMYDATTGNWILNIVNGSSGTVTYSQNGDVMIYILNAARGWLTLWNSSKVIAYGYSQTSAYSSNGYWMWRPPLGASLDWKRGIEWNTTVPVLPGASISRIGEGVIVARSVASNVANFVSIVGYSAATGQQLWVHNATGEEATTGSMAPPTATIGNGVYAIFRQETMQWYGYDLKTGNKLWGPSEPHPNAWGMYITNGFPSVIFNGTLYAMAMDGIHAYDARTGAHLWDHEAANAGLESAYGIYPYVRQMTSAEGKLYAATGHTHLIPLFRGAHLECIDGATGSLVWKVLGWMQNTAIADGILVTLNAYDNQIYAFGKGRSATTISASPVTISQGGATTIQGTVTDQSPGQTCLGIPAAGTPAVSDASMELWMEYLYEQQAKPTNTTGVPVTLTAFDPNGNTETIGTVASDASGNYAIQWIPPVPGVYKITATFAGSKSYYASSVETAISVTAATSQPKTSPEPTVTTAPSTPTPAVSSSPSSSPSEAPQPASGTPSTTYLAIGIAAVIIIAAAATLILRRRK